MADPSLTFPTPRYLFVRHGEDSLVACRVLAAAAGARRPAASRVPRTGGLVAAGAEGRWLLTLCRSGGRAVILTRISPRGRLVTERRLRLPGPMPDGTALLGLMPLGTAGGDLLLLAGTDLLRLPAVPSEADSASLIATDVVAAAPDAAGHVLVVSREAGDCWRVGWAGDAPAPAVRVPGAGERALLGYPGRGAGRLPDGLVALERSDGSWLLAAGTPLEQALRTGPLDRVVGVVRSPRLGPALLTLEGSTGRRLSLVSARGRRVVREGRPVTAFATCLTAPWAALAQADGEVVVTSLARPLGRVVGRWRGTVEATVLGRTDPA